MDVKHLDTLGWPVVRECERSYLPGNQGIVGLTLPVPLAHAVSEALMVGPILALTTEPPRWIFLAETPAGRCPNLPVGIGLMSGPSRIPMPPSEGTSWVREPTTKRVPSFMALLRAVRGVLP